MRARIVFLIKHSEPEKRVPLYFMEMGFDCCSSYIMIFNLGFHLNFSVNGGFVSV